MPISYFMESELPLNLYSWPYCGVCNKKVDKILVGRTINEYTVEITACCHGEMERLTIPYDTTMGGHIGGTAFNQKQLK